MEIITILLIAVGLAMDAFAVSITSGFTIKRQRFKSAVKIGAFFGGFQALMPILGYFLGYGFRDLIVEVDHWVAFGILCFIGSKMIYESIKRDPKKKKKDYLNNTVLLWLAIATSIDAFAVGIGFAFLEMDIFVPAIIIGIITFIISFAGVYIGNKLGHIIKNKIGIVGGIILIAIGFKILIEHLM